MGPSSVDLLGSSSVYGGGGVVSYGPTAPPVTSSYVGSRSCVISADDIKLIEFLCRHRYEKKKKEHVRLVG